MIKANDFLRTVSLTFRDYYNRMHDQLLKYGGDELEPYVTDDVIHYVIKVVAERAVYQDDYADISGVTEHLAIDTVNDLPPDLDNEIHEKMYEAIYSISEMCKSLYTDFDNQIKANNKYDYLRYLDINNPLAFKIDGNEVNINLDIKENQSYFYTDIEETIGLVAYLLGDGDKKNNIYQYDEAKTFIKFMMEGLLSLRVTSFTYHTLEYLLENYSRFMDGDMHKGKGPTYFAYSCLELSLYNAVLPLIKEVARMTDYREPVKVVFKNKDTIAVFECVEYVEV